MKRKLWMCGLLSLAVVGLSVQQASAFFWRHCCCNNRYSTYICVRPYNAFSPVCFGSICCNGCAPLQVCTPPCGGGGCNTCGWSPQMAPPPFMHAGFNVPSLAPPCMGNACTPAYAAYPYYVSPPPPMAPAPPTMAHHGHHGHHHGMQPVGYQPGVYPGFWPNYPMGYWTNGYADPAYWHSGMPQGR